MKEVNGVKIYQVGDCDQVFAPNEKDAKEFMVGMIDEKTVNEMIEFNPIKELSQKEFDNGKMYWDDDGDMDRAFKRKNKISFKSALLKSMVDGSKSGHFSTTE